MGNKGSEVFNRIMVLIWVIIFVVVVVVLAASFLSENHITTGDGEPKIIAKIESLTCESDDILYPFLKFDESTKKELRFVATFDEQKMSTISLQQILYYDDPELITQSEAENHAELNTRFGEDGLGADALEANYGKLEDALRISLYGRGDELNDSSLKYFLLDNESASNFENVRMSYEKLGMNCVGNNT